MSDRNLIQQGALTWEELEDMAREDEAKQLAAQTVHLHYGRLVRDGLGLSAQLNWCRTHAEPVWVYEDDSYLCPHDPSGSPRPGHEIIGFPYLMQEHFD